MGFIGFLVFGYYEVTSLLGWTLDVLFVFVSVSFNNGIDWLCPQIFRLMERTYLVMHMF